MVSVLKNQWLLLRLAAGLSRAETPRGWVSNALRAVNFVLVTFAFCALIYAIFFWFVFLLITSESNPSSYTTAHIVMVIITLVFGVLFATLLTPRLLYFPIKLTSFDNITRKTKIKGYALALAMSSVMVLIFMLGPYTTRSSPEDIVGDLTISVISWPTVILIEVLLLVSYSVTSWKIRGFGGNTMAQVALWLAYTPFFALLLLVGWIGWFPILSVVYGTIYYEF